MNKVYFFYGDEDFGGSYIAAESFKDARTIAMGISNIVDHVDNPFLDVKGFICRENQESKGKPIYTEYSGELDVNEITELGLQWFYCMNEDCEMCYGKVGIKDNIEILNEDEYKCKICGEVFKIPYLP